MISLVLALITTAGAPPRFEVASVKPSANCVVVGGGRGGGAVPGINSPDRLELRCRTLADLVKMAYVQYAGGHRGVAIGDDPISGGPSWVHSERFDIEAKAESP